MHQQLRMQQQKFAYLWNGNGWITGTYEKSKSEEQTKSGLRFLQLNP